MKHNESIIVNANEAIAWGALSSGVDFMSHYPGSPVNFVDRYLKKLNERFNRKIEFNDSLNEHVAALAAAGASYCGARSLCVMKHVGLNIAADPLNYLGYTGVKGGMVIVVGTDPGANSSTGEEDVHWYVPQFNFPLFEPTTVEECFAYTQQAFSLSEKHEIPVLLFVPGRLAYNVSTINVEVETAQRKEEFYFEKDREKYINVGQRAVTNHKKLVKKIDEIGQREFVAKDLFNQAASLGVITRGLSFTLVYELVEELKLSEQIHLLNLDLVYPLNTKQIIDFSEGKSELLIIEDQDGFLENQIKMHCFNELDCKIYGKDVFPSYGELSREQIAGFLGEKFGLEVKPAKAMETPMVPERLGSFCEGCPHTGSFFSIDAVLKELDGVIGGDIGCSSLPPFRADWLLCMNAGIGISQGMAQVLGAQPIISTGGDGSFFHAGALSLMNAIHNKINLIHMVFDNSTIAMTGHQKSPTGENFDHHAFLTSIGVDKIIDVTPYDPKDFIKKFKEELNGNGVRVFWVKGACVLGGNDYIEIRRLVLYPEIDPTKCGDCTKCYTELACPSIMNLKSFPDVELKIDLDRCVRCGVCHEICPNEAITIHNVI